jgi:hypothetical protein
MAIPYLNVQFPHVSSGSGACEFVAYLGRCGVADVRLGQRFDYQRLNVDLVHDEVICCAGVSPAFGDIEYFGNALDEAEAYRIRGDINDLVRRPQFGAAIVMALPADDEITLTEATELTRRITLSIAGNRRLAIYSAIHDPARATPGARNRHGHMLFPRREIKDDCLFGPAIRDMFARPLSVGANGSTVTVEGNRWPDFYLRQLQAYFAELGIDLAVDPIAPFPGQHWPAHISLDDPRVKILKKRNRTLNIDAIHGDPVQLIAKLLRGRSLMRILEVQRLIDKFIDNEGERRTRLETILGDADIMTYVADPAAAKPRYITTGSVDHSIQRACELVDRAAREPDIRSIYAITAPSHADGTNGLAQLQALQLTADVPLLLGNNHSECEIFSRAIASCGPAISTIKAALSDPSKPASARKRAATSWANRLVIVPRAESVDDQTLAQIILRANASQATLILAHDQSKQAGIVNHRLAAYAVERLAVVQKGDEEHHAAATERFLRAGLIGPAIELLAQYQDIKFDQVDDQLDETGPFDFFVCNDPRRLKVATETIRSLRLREGKLDTPIELRHPLKPIWLSRDEWIVFTRTDYSVRPPRIRASELARILEIDSHHNAINVMLSGGGTEAIELKRFAHLRPAHALLVREARNLNKELRLRIDVSEVHHVWAALLLATQHRFATLIVDPRLATDIPSLILTTRASLPAALPHQLTSRPDPDAEIVAATNDGELPPSLSEMFDVKFMSETATLAPSTVVSDNSFTGSPRETSELEPFPEPAPAISMRTPSIAPLHERVRAVLDSIPHTRRGFQRLHERLSHDNRDRDANAEHILSLCHPDGPTAAIVKLLTRPNSVAALNSLANLDLPHELEQLSPRSWDNWELYCLKMDLSTMQFDFANWSITPTPSTQTVASAQSINSVK